MKWGDRRRVNAIVKRQRRMFAEGDGDRLLIGRLHRRTRAPQPNRRRAGVWIFVAMLPVALLGLAAAWRAGAPQPPA